MSITILNELYGYGKYGDPDCPTYDDVFYYTGSAIDYMYWGYPPTNRSMGFTPHSDYWRIYRVCFNTKTIPDEEVISAYIVGYGVYCSNGGWVQGWLVNMDGHALHDHLMYGKIRTVPYNDPDKIIGTFTCPVVNDSTAKWMGVFNERGIAYLESKRGGVARIGMLATVFPPSSDSSGTCYVAYATNPLKTEIWINANPGYKTPFYLWIEETKFAYIDASYTKRTKEGTLTGDPDGDPYQAWVYGDYQYYTDYLGKVRRILGTLTGLTGKAPYQISINTKSPMLGTHYCYIDSSGNERAFEGT